MTVPARDEISRLDVAQQRLANALLRLEGAMARSSETVPDKVAESDRQLAVLREELATLKKENADLEDANDAAVARIEETLSRLKSLLVA